MIIGVTGYLGSGRKTFARFLESSYGFKRISIEGFLVRELEEKNIAPTKENILRLRVELFSKHGERYVAESLKSGLIPGEKYVIEDIRSLGELEVFRKVPNFVLIGIEAPFEFRCKRLFSRAGEYDPRTVEEFKKMEELESNDCGFGQNLSGCMKKVDKTLLNLNTEFIFRENIRDLMKEILK